MPTEWEIKLSIPDGQTAGRILRDTEIIQLSESPFQTVPMRARYYDTPDGCLEARRWTLRLRNEGGCDIAALKLQGESRGGVYRRDEFEAAAESVESAVPGLLAAGAPPELAELIKSGLNERCRIEFDRQAVPLSWDGGTKAMLSIDQGAIYAGGRTLPLLELELELLSGETEDLLDLAERLKQAYRLTPGLLGKYVRGLRLLREP